METLVLTGAPEAILGRFEEPLALCTAVERARAAKFRFDSDRDAYVAAHVLVRMTAARMLGKAPENLTITQKCPTCAGPHGVPTVVEAPSLTVSWSHTRGYVAAAAGSGPVGVDVENPRRDLGDVLVDRVLAPAEARWVRAAADAQDAFLQLWVRKESLIKTGSATLGTLADVDLVGDAGELAELWREHRFTGWSGGPAVGAVAAPGAAQVITL